MHESEIATAADYADAMLTARRAKHVLVLLLILMIMGQLTLFFLVKYDVVAIPVGPTTAPATEPATTRPAVSYVWDGMNYLCLAFLAMGLISTLLLSLVLLLITNIMLVGRLIGVARLTSAFLWCLVLLLLLFPWQAFLRMNPDLPPAEVTWKWPGVLYTWGELANQTHGASFTDELSRFAILKWVRFVGFPVVALIMLLVIQFKSNKGMRQCWARKRQCRLKGDAGLADTFDMREERGQIPGEVVVYEPYTLWGSVGGNVKVIEGGKFYLRGSIYGDLVVEFGGRVHIYGSITGNVIVQHGAKLIHSGVIGGDAVNEGGRIFIEAGSKVNGKIKTKSGNTKIDPHFNKPEA